MTREVSEYELDEQMITHFFQHVAQGFIGLSAEQAYNRSAEQIDLAMAGYRRNPKMSKIQCRPRDCFACCITQKEVDSSPFEVGRILDRAESEDRLQNIVERSERVAARPQGGVCPLLSKKGRCTVYDIRPLSCRIHHSLDRKGCHQPGGHFRQDNQLRTILGLICAVGLHGLNRLMSGKGNPRFRLFEQLAKLGRERLEKRAAA